MRVAEIVGQQVKGARADRGLTQAELGQRVGEYLGKAWSRQAVYQAEQGRRDFTAAEIAALALVLGRPISSFFLPVDEEAVEFPSGLKLTYQEFFDSAFPGKRSLRPEELEAVARAAARHMQGVLQKLRASYSEMELEEALHRGLAEEAPTYWAKKP